LCALFACAAHAGEGYEERYEFMSFYCLECHDATIQKAEVRLDNISYQIITRDQVPFWRSVYESMENHSMPPKDELQPESDEIDGVMRWMRRGLINPRPPRPARPTLRMGEAYEHAIRRAFDLEIQLPKGSLIGRGKSLGAKGKPVLISAEIMKAYIANARRIADRVIPPADYSLACDTKRDGRLFADPTAAPESEYIEQTVLRLASAAFGREVSAPEVQAYIGLAKARRTMGDSLEASLNAALRLILVANEFIYLDRAAQDR
jgi:hypothetical protein